MPNRKTFDPREKYDHSSRPVGHAQRNDLKPDIIEDVPDRASPGRRKTENRDSKQGPPRPR